MEPTRGSAAVRSELLDSAVRQARDSAHETLNKRKVRNDKMVLNHEYERGEGLRKVMESDTGQLIQDIILKHMKADELAKASREGDANALALAVERVSVVQAILDELQLTVALSKRARERLDELGA